ncbi:unnamed protein product, partial [Discosporangium mesarthrocarpum]
MSAAQGRSGRRGRDARREARASNQSRHIPYISRNIPVTNLVSDEALEIIEANAETILEEIGLEFRDDPESLDLWKSVGADVQGERVHFPKGLCRQLL